MTTLRKHLADAYADAMRKTYPSNVLHLTVAAAAGMLMNMHKGDVERAIASCSRDTVFWLAVVGKLNEVRENSNVLPFARAR